MTLKSSVAVYDAAVRVSGWSWCSLLALSLGSPAVLAQNSSPDWLPLERQADPNDPAFARLPNAAFPSPEIRAVPVDRGPKFERAQLAAYFREGALAEAKAAYDAYRWSLAKEKLSQVTDTSNPVQFLRALTMYRSGDFENAGKAFEVLAVEYLPLRDRSLVHAGWSYEGARNWQRARAVFEQVSPASRLNIDAKLGLARSLKNLKDVKGAIAVIEPSSERAAPPWGRDTGAEALMALADLQLARADAKGEKKTLAALWSKHPLSPQAKRAEARMGTIASLPHDALIARAEVLIDAHRNAQGISLLEPLIATQKLPDPLACRAHFALGKGYRKQRLHPKAAATLLPVTQKCTDADLRARALYTLGFSQTIVAPALAGDTYTLLTRLYPSHTFADDGLFFAADTYLRAGQTEQGLERLTELVDRYPTADFAAEALFKLFWVAKANGQWQDANDALAEIEKRWATADDSSELERAGYWRARVAEAADQKGDAVALYAKVAREHPASYYGLISREKLEGLDASKAEAIRAETAAPPSGQDAFPIYAGPVARDPSFLSALELLRLGFGELVPMEILSIDRTNLPGDSLRLMVQVLAQAGEARAAHGMTRLWLRRDLNGRFTRENRPVWETAYPQVFRDLVERSAQAAGTLDPDLLQALMREESALDPKALSRAGALGLCQLMPATAAEVAAQLKLGRPSTAALLEPELNLQLGAKYLSDLVFRMKGAKPFALASYNAGESAVNRWRRTNGDADLAEWVENIPLQETRNYVKRVLRSYVTYKLLYVPGEMAQTVGPIPVKPAAPVKASPVAKPALKRKPG